MEMIETRGDFMLSEIGYTAVKSTTAAIVLFILARIMGKKQISQLTFFDYVVGISIGSIAAALSVDPRISFAQGITGMVIWAAFPLILYFLSSKSILARRLLDGNSAILIQNGKIIEKNLARTKLTVNDLLEELRIKAVFNIADVEFALLETNGKVSVLKRTAKQTVTNADLKIQAEQQGLCANLIIDGRVMKNNLALLGKDETWLLSELKKQKVNTVRDVLLASCGANGVLHVDLKNQDPPVFSVLQ